MAGNILIPHTFAADVGPEPLNLLDLCYSALAGPFNTLSTFTNYYIDSGAANALAITTGAQQIVSLTDGLLLVVKCSNTSTIGNPTLQINALAAQTIVDGLAESLSPGALINGVRYLFLYDGFKFRVLNPSVPGGVGSGTAGVDASTIIIGHTYTAWRSAARTLASNAVPFIDPVVQFNNVPIGVYEVDYNVSFLAANTTMGVQGGLFGSPGPFGTAISMWMSLLGNAGGTTVNSPVGMSANSYADNAAAATEYAVKISGSFSVTAASQIGVFWAQRVSNAGNLTMNPGSYLAITRLA